MRHGMRLDHVDHSWIHTVGKDRPYDTPLTEEGKIEVYHLACERFREKV